MFLCSNTVTMYWPSSCMYLRVPVHSFYYEANYILRFYPHLKCYACFQLCTMEECVSLSFWMEKALLPGSETLGLMERVAVSVS